jgi:hypothetical protein
LVLTPRHPWLSPFRKLYDFPVTNRPLKAAPPAVDQSIRFFELERGALRLVS